MKKFLFYAIIMVSTMGFSFPEKQTITNAGNTFSPAILTLEAGENVEFSLGSSHNAIEVTKETWDANGNTPKSGGFSVPFGGGEVIFPTPGVYYYVCEPHASLGMKGTIIVEGSTAISSVSDNISGFNVFPDPAYEFITISYTLSSTAIVNIRLINIVGDDVASILNESQVPGQYTNTYSLKNDLTPGIYFVNINSNNQSFISKVFIQ